MESGDNKKQEYQARYYTFPGFLDGGALAPAFMTTNNQDNENKIQDDEDKITYLKPRQASKRPPERVSPRQSPSETLLKLELPQNHFGYFLRLLKGLGFGEAYTQEETSIYGTRSYTYLPAKGSQGPRIFIYIPKWIMTDSTRPSIDAIIALGSAFKAGSFVLVFCENPSQANIDIIQIIKYGWKPRYKECELVPWEQIEQLKNLDAQRQKFWIRNTLGFEIT